MIASPRHGLDAGLRISLLLASGLASLLLYLCVIWPLSYELTEGPYFTYDYLRATPAVWERLYRLFEQLPWLSPWARPSLELLGGLWLLLYSTLFGLMLAAFFTLRWAV